MGFPPPLPSLSSTHAAATSALHSLGESVDLEARRLEQARIALAHRLSPLQRLRVCCVCCRVQGELGREGGLWAERRKAGACPSSSPPPASTRQPPVSTRQHQAAPGSTRHLHRLPAPGVASACTRAGRRAGTTLTHHNNHPPRHADPLTSASASRASCTCCFSTSITSAAAAAASASAASAFSRSCCSSA